MKCPACSAKGKNVDDKVFQCPKCQAIFAEAIYLGDSYNYVLPYWDKGEAENERYFDFICLGSDGVTRRHGWYNPETKRITQTG